MINYFEIVVSGTRYTIYIYDVEQLNNIVA